MTEKVFRQIIMSMAERVRDGKVLDRAEIALLAGFAAGSIMRIEELEATVKALREPLMAEMARLGQEQEDQE